MRVLTLSSFTCLIAVSLLWGQGENTLDQHVREGQDAIYRLDYAAAERIFEQTIAENPDSPVGYGMLSITTWNELLFAAANQALDDYATPTPFTKGRTHKNVNREIRRFREANNNLLTVCERILENNPKDVLALYFRGLAYENLSAEAIVITKNTGSAINYGKRAKNIHEQVLALDPNFVDANISIAGNEFAKATLPWSIKWLAFLLGIRGSKERAFQKLELVSQKGKYRQLDAQVVLALLHSWKGDPSRSVTIFEELRAKYPQNYLFDINLAAIYHLKLNDAKSALRIYQQLLQTLPNKASGLHAGEIYFRIGKTYVQLREYGLALQAFNKAVEEPKGELETEPLTYFQMAQIHDERGEKGQAIGYYGQVLNYSGPQDALKVEMKEARRRLPRLKP
ncbi:tetratricopeptide repeat protein [Acidobacteria bacterium AH-259-D05]|nr:tetratricopeptide repeat protein [Acidobacteria bacterium AH-259-D05]